MIQSMQRASVTQLIVRQLNFCYFQRAAAIIPFLADEGCSAGTLAPLHQCLSATQMFRFIPSNVQGQKRYSSCGSRVRHYQGVSDLGQVDELLVGGGAHVEANGEHLFQSGHDERRLH